MTETIMTKMLKDKVAKFNCRYEFLNIETGMTAKSLPDLYYYEKNSNHFGWIELKHVKTFKIDEIKIPWREGQLARGFEMHKAGINIKLLVMNDIKPKEYIIIPASYWKQCYDPLEFTSGLITYGLWLELMPNKLLSILNSY